MNILGLDIGGANIKAAFPDSSSCSTMPFALWKRPDALTGILRTVIEGFPGIDAIAMTMTAELADCFETKAEGVRFVVEATVAAAPSCSIHIWQTGGEFVDPDVACEIPSLVAAANWHAQATWVGRMVPGSAAVLIDVGSTTTDIIPLWQGSPVPEGLTDVERLQSRELVYSGVRRTPIYAIAQSVPRGNSWCPLAGELFATMLDIHLIRGNIAEDSADCDTANGRPATRSQATGRLARMLCCDSTELDSGDIESIALFLEDVQRQRISGALNTVLGRITASTEKHESQDLRGSTSCDVTDVDFVTSGSGEFLAFDVARASTAPDPAKITRLPDIIGDKGATAACAFALARLAEERL